MLRRDPAAPVRFEVAPVQGTALEGPLLYLPADLDGAAAPPAAGGLFAGIADDGQGGGADARGCG